MYIVNGSHGRCRGLSSCSSAAHTLSRSRAIAALVHACDGAAPSQPEPVLGAGERRSGRLSHNHARAMDGLDCAHARSGTASWTLAPGRPYLTCAPLLRLLPMAAGPSCGAALHSRRREHPDGVVGVVGVVWGVVVGSEGHERNGTVITKAGIPVALTTLTTTSSQATPLTQHHAGRSAPTARILLARFQSILEISVRTPLAALGTCCVPCGWRASRDLAE